MAGPSTPDAVALAAQLTRGLAAGVAWLDASGRHRFVNEGYARVFGRTVADLEGTTFAEVVEETLPPAPARLEIVRADRRLELQIRDGDGVGGLFVQVEPLPPERPPARDGLPQLVDVLDSFHDVVAVVDEALVVRWVNPHATELFAHRRASLLGRPLPELYPSLAGSDVERRLRAAMTTGRADHFEVLFPPSNRWLEVHLNPGGRELTLVVRDITERKIATEQLRRSEHLRALGRLAGGVAHEINNQMTVIVGFGSMLARRLPDERDRVHVERMVAAAERTAKVSTQLLTFSRRQEARPVALDLHVVLEEFRPVLERIVGSEVLLRYVLAPEGARVFADRAQIEQALLNLVSNARDAMPGGGPVVVQTSRLPIDELASQAWYAGSPATAAEWIVLSVEDTGEGMTPEIAARAFEPFFTTRPVGEGTGLGLSTVYGVVTTAGGVVGLDTWPGKGTRVRIALPSGEVPALAPTRIPASGGGLVLLVEGDPAQRASLARALAEGGYTVASASDPEGALMVLDGQSPALVVVDLGLPQARRMARRVREGGSTRVLYVSPQARDDLERRGMLEPDEAFLQRPFGPAVLLHRLAELAKG